MDYNDKLNEMLESEKAQIKQQDAKKLAYFAHQREAFAPLADALKEISRSVDPTIASFKIDQGSADIRIESRLISSVRYQVRPNSSGLYMAAPGFKADVTTTYPYLPDGLEKSYRTLEFQSVDEVMDDLLKLIAKASARK